MPWPKSKQKRDNVVSFRLSDDELELAITKAGGRHRVGQYIRTQLFAVAPAASGATDATGS